MHKQPNLLRFIELYILETQSQFEKKNRKYFFLIYCIIVWREHKYCVDGTIPSTKSILHALSSLNDEEKVFLVIFYCLVEVKIL